LKSNYLAAVVNVTHAEETHADIEGNVLSFFWVNKIRFRKREHTMRSRTSFASTRGGDVGWVRGSKVLSSVGGENRPLGIDNLLLTYFRSSI